MPRVLPYLAAAALLMAAGVFHGLWTGRWGLSEKLDTAAASLGNVPLRVGDWQASSVELDARQIEVAEIAGHLSRRYVHDHTGQELMVMLVCGRPGPISVHPPEVCFTGAGYAQTGQRRRQPLPSDRPGGSAEFWMTQFRKTGPAPERIQLFWAWGDGKSWQAVDNPRMEFGQRQVLYKLYVVRRLARPDDSVLDEHVLEFLGVFLPQLETFLSQSS